MNDITQAFFLALGLLTHLDPILREIIGLSLAVSLSAVALATLMGLPLGAGLALSRFPSREVFIVLNNTLLGLPPVVVGLVVYLLLSRSGPFGVWGLLFTPAAMVLAQCVLVTPIIMALTRQQIEDLWMEYAEQLQSLGASRWRAIPTLLWEGRHSLMTCILAGFGRAIGEVGAIIIVGGNIDHYTRTMTTAIALETAKGDLALALALGFVLITLSMVVNGTVYGLKEHALHRGLSGITAP
jgi:tungstate transport system permease protein